MGQRGFQHHSCKGISNYLRSQSNSLKQTKRTNYSPQWKPLAQTYYIYSNGLLDPEDGNSMLLQNVGKYLSADMAKHPRRPVQMAWHAICMTWKAQNFASIICIICNKLQEYKTKLTWSACCFQLFVHLSSFISQDNWECPSITQSDDKAKIPSTNIFTNWPSHLK